MNKLHFTKMHGAGNDYIYVDAFHTTVANPEELSIRLSNRHFGVGSDGLVLICPPTDADCDLRMRMFNADGSEAQMCGNASRCIGKFAYERGLCHKNPIRMQTLAGVKVLHLTLTEDDKVSEVTVDMGEPKLEGPVELQGYDMECVNMGNPHAVTFIPRLDEIDVWGDGKTLEVDPYFPNRSNIEFAEVLNRKELRMRVWERGSGETLACGTGACATAVAAIHRGLADREVTLHLLGGDLRILWDADSNHVMLTGPAEFVFDGEIS